MGDDELCRYAIGVKESNGIKIRTQMMKKFNRLYRVLKERKLLARIGFEVRQRTWENVSDKEILETARSLLREKGITGRQEFRDADSGLYSILGKRGLFDKIGFVDKKIDWTDMDDEQIVELAQKMIKERGIIGNAKLQEADNRLYQALRRRGLLSRRVFKAKIIYWGEDKTQQRPWGEKSDEEIIELARSMIIQKGITRRSELKKADSGLYKVLCQRNLLGALGLRRKKRETRWSVYSDEELVELARKTMAENGINGRAELDEANPKLYGALRRRRLLGKVGFVRKQRSWVGMGNDELIEHARKVMNEKGISTKKELENADLGLYNILRKRKLLDEVGFVETSRHWMKMTNAEILSIALRIAKEKKITKRKDFDREDHSMYETLRKRRLLDAVFSEIENQENSNGLNEISDALGDFGSDDE